METIRKFVRKQNNALWVLLIIFIVGEVFFFSSHFFMPVDMGSRLTPLNATLQLGEDRKVTLVRWDYSPGQSMMEVELSIQNLTFDGQDRYVARAYIMAGGTVSREPEYIITEPNYMVMHFSDIPATWTDISLWITLDNMEDSSVLKLYTNNVAVNRVEKIASMSQTQYQVRRLQDQIDAFKNEQVELESQIEATKEKIALLEAGNKNLVADKEFQTAEQVKETERIIEENNYKISEYEHLIDDLTGQINERESLIKQTERKISALQETEGGEK